MLAGALVEDFLKRGVAPAIISDDGRTTTYAELHALVRSWGVRLQELAIGAGESVALQGGYSAELLGCFFALAANGNIVVPLTPQSPGLAEENLRLAEVGHVLDVPTRGAASHARRGVTGSDPLLAGLRARQGAGLVLFSSGTEGKPKIVLHDLARLLKKYDRPLRPMRTLLFLVFDHIAGLDTLFYTLCAGGCCVVENTRRPEAVAQAIAAHRVEVLAATPSFLQLLLASEAHLHNDLSCLKIIAYGSESMPPHVLERIGTALPNTRLLQRYGTTELGSPASRSREDGTLWMRIDGEKVRSKVVDGVLWIQTETAMLGYLNAPSPFDEEGYFCTGDLVEVDGSWIRIVGRRSEVINVGGHKVHPGEVENVLLQMPNVAGVVVHGEPNALMGHIVVATLTLKTPQPSAELKQAVREFCRGRLLSHQVPAKIVASETPPHGYRFKKLRPPTG